MKILGLEVSNREGILLGITVAAGLIYGILLLSRMGNQNSGENADQIYELLSSRTASLESNLKTFDSLCTKMKIGGFKLPSTEESAEVGIQIDKIARECELEFTGLTASTPKKGKKFQTIGYRFKSTSTLNALIRFTDLIQNGEYLITFENWDMKPADDPSKVVANLSIRAYFSGTSRGGI